MICYQFITKSNSFRNMKQKTKCTVPTTNLGKKRHGKNVKNVFFYLYILLRYSKKNATEIR